MASPNPITRSIFIPFIFESDLYTVMTTHSTLANCLRPPLHFWPKLLQKRDQKRRKEVPVFLFKFLCQCSILQPNISTYLYKKKVKNWYEKSRVGCTALGNPWRGMCVKLLVHPLTLVAWADVAIRAVIAIQTTIESAITFTTNVDVHRHSIIRTQDQQVPRVTCRTEPRDRTELSSHTLTIERHRRLQLKELTI